MRILHFSDVHLPVQPGDVGLPSWFDKRGAGRLNLLLGRGRCFAQAPTKLAALERFAREQDVDLVINTGDTTSLGTLSELERARRALEPFRSFPQGLLTLPGNHDLYVPGSLAAYATTLEPWIRTDRPEWAVVDGRWPFVRFFGEHLVVVGVNSARPNRPLWRSTGLVGPAQVDALGRILEQADVRERVVLVMTHYAPRLADGTPDKRTHGLVDADAFLAACRGIRRGGILHGHVHWCYRVAPEGLQVPAYCAGSATKEGREGLWLFDVDADGLRATPGRWREDAYVLGADAAAE